MDQPYIVYTPIHRLIILLFLSLIMTSICLFMVFTPAGDLKINSGIYSTLPEPVLRFIGYFGTFFFGAGIWLSASRLINRKPALILTSETITDNSSWYTFGTVKWTDIESITLMSVQGQRHLSFNLKIHPKMKTIGNYLSQINQSLGYGAFNIAEVNVGIKLEEIISKINQYAPGLVAKE